MKIVCGENKMLVGVERKRNGLVKEIRFWVGKVWLELRVFWICEDCGVKVGEMLESLVEEGG